MDFDELVLRERFARLGPIRAIDRVPCGSPAIVVLRLAPGCRNPRTIDATFALARRGLTMLSAKRAVEFLVSLGQVLVELPAVEDRKILSAELSAAGVAAAFEPASTPVGAG